MADGAQARRTGLTGLACRAIELWALLGGIVLLGVALMTTWSAASGYVLRKPLPGDFELTEMLVAVAAFAFLPYCQIMNANVTADIFTARAGPRTVAAFTLLSALVALGFSLLLFWRMLAGLQDYRQYVETTAILQIPIWYAYIPALLSLALLCIASAISVRESLRNGFGTR